ncbi:DUF4397 domain-containing protein [Sediminibacterium goheungense]|uniref:DUF4397 domain-containing protein n=1 Tax=Sediminibacterium goheungense TaxID=1086393 RepID=A0A4R6J1Q8_9BACT|nr:DUF4397 domain-containing protein [Sediminibacterium goheungense]TDO28196.1 hypothetical protein BC659_0258 [Sediminibacterium goheungense]
MKKLIIPIIAIITAVGLMSCEKNIQRELDLVPTTGKAYIKINYAMAYAVNSNAQLKINGNRVSTTLTFPYPFPGGGLNTGGSSNPDYLALDPKQIDLVVSRPKVGTSEDSVVLFSQSFAGNAIFFGTNYTIHLTDTGANAKGVVVTDNITLPDSGYSRFKYVNLLPNQTALDLYYGTAKVASNIAYQGSSPEFTVQVTGAAASWAIRPAGAASTTTALATYSMTVPNQRSFTVFSSGYSGTSGTRAARISLIYNR